jgi:hypothetical protein
MEAVRVRAFALRCLTFPSSSYQSWRAHGWSQTQPRAPCSAQVALYRYQTEPASSTRWLFIPDPLITMFAHDPLAVGVYVAIARLALAAKGAVPLAARDLVTWVGSTRDADRAAVMRRIVKLTAAGWLVVERVTANKHRLHPAWGPDQHNAGRPWRFGTDDLGRPAHLRGRRVPLALLDVY